jgi:hypothetical protein
MLDTIIPTIKGFLFNPVETFQASCADETRAVLSYFGVLLLFDAVLVAGFEMMLLFFEYLLVSGTASASGVGHGTSAGMTLGMVFLIPATVFLSIVIGGSIFLFIFSLWTHLWVYLLGGNKGFMQTLHAILYSTTPALLLGWIPVVGMFASLWTLLLFFFGIREFQEISDGKAVDVILLSVFLPLFLLILLFTLAIIAITSHGGLFSFYSSYR